MPRFGDGSFERKEKRLERVRKVFWETTESVAPEIYEDLRRCVLPFARDCPSDDENTDFQGALTEWSKRFHLVDQWCIEEARRVIASWLPPKPSENPDDRGLQLSWVEFEVPFSGIPIHEIQYDPTTETREEFRKRVQRELTPFMDRVDRVVEGEEGVEKVRFKWGDDSGGHPRHFEWLVRYTVKEEPYSAISDAEKGVSEQAVRNAVTRLADLMELTLR